MEKDSLSFKRGRGDWAVWDDISEIIVAADSWKKLICDIEHPWLCWNVNDDWCLLQQKLVVHAGWTPVVGYDPRCGPPRKMVPDAVLVDFNERLRLPMMSMLFPIEFVFLFCDRLAFWHSDLLLSDHEMRKVALRFSRIEQGETIAVRPISWRIIFSPKQWRYWELIGCTTRTASEDQFNKGCGWWRNFWHHNNRTEDPKDPKWRGYGWDHGVGIMYWKRKHGGRVVGLSERKFAKGHYSRTSKANYVAMSPNNEFRDLRVDLAENFDLRICARELGLENYLEPERGSV